MIHARTSVLPTIVLSLTFSIPGRADDPELIGHWRFAGDVRDASGTGNDGVNHGVDLSAAGPDGTAKTAGRFNGRDAYAEVRDHASLKLGTREFSIAAWIHTDENLDDLPGDLVAKFDAKQRRGFHLGIVNNIAAPSTPANYQQIQFGIDSGKLDAKWVDCGRPGNAILIWSLCVFDGQLYCGTCVQGEHESGRVHRYQGGESWEDLGSPGKANSVSSLAEYKGQLYASVTKYRLRGSALSESTNPHLGGQVYRHDGGKKWVFCGQLPETEAIAGMVVFKGKLYASSLYKPAGLFRYEGGTKWTSCGSPNGKRCEALGVYNGALYATGYDEGGLYRYDGQTWTHCGIVPGATQTYSFATVDGQLLIGTWPKGEVYRYAGDNHFVNVGRLGKEEEVMGMALYNGKLYAGSLPLAEVYRFDSPMSWANIGRLDFTPNLRYRRAWSVAVFQGRLFCGTLPGGRVFSIEAGKCATLDRALPTGWNHVAAVKEKDRLKLYLNGKLAATSSPFDAKAFDLSNDLPLTIGRGPHDNFNGRMRDVRLYNAALAFDQIERLAR